MATLIEDIQALLEPLATGGCHYGACLTQPAPDEYIVWLRVVSLPNVTFDGPSDLQNTRIQVDTIATTVQRAAALADIVSSTLVNSAITVVPLETQDMFEEDVRRWRVVSDFSVWAKN